MPDTRLILKKVTDSKDIPLAGTVSFGRSEQNTVRLLEGSPSRHHAEISIDASTAFVQDVGSTNGTYVNGRRIDPHIKVKLASGDRLKFDIEEFVFRIERPAPVIDPDKTLFRPPSAAATVVRTVPPAPAVAAPRPLAPSAAAPPAAPARPSPPVTAPPAAPARPSATGPPPTPAAAPAAAPAAPISATPPPTPAAPAPAPAARAPRAPAPAAAEGGPKPPPAWIDDPNAARTIFIGAPRKPKAAEGAAPAPELLQPQGETPCLIITNGVRIGERVDLLAAELPLRVWKVGSQNARDVCLTDPGVSALHATLKHENGTWLLTDDLSANGTFVNDAKVLKSYLSDGDRIRFGPVDCVFRLPAAAAKSGSAGGSRAKRVGLIVAVAFALTLTAIFIVLRLFK